MNYVENFNFYGIDAKEIPCIKGEGVPTKATDGAVGCLYMDTNTKILYKCTTVSEGTCTWETFEGEKGDPGTDGKDGVTFTPSVSADGTLSWTNNGGLTNPEPVNIVGNVESIGEIVQTMGHSETAVMSQKAVTEVIDGLGFKRGEFVAPNIIEDHSFSLTEKAIWTTSGSMASTQNTTTFTAINELVDVIPGYTYLIPNFFGNIILFDTNGKNGVETKWLNEHQRTDLEFIIPEDKCKLGISYITTSPVTEVYRLTPTNEEVAELPLFNEEFLLKEENLKTDEVKEYISSLVPEVFQKDMDAFIPPNILVGFSISLTEKAIWTTSGSMASTQNTTTFTAINELVDVIPGYTYLIPNFFGNIILFDTNGKNGVETKWLNEHQRTDLEFIIPEDKCKLGISYITTSPVTEVYRLTPNSEEINMLPDLRDTFSIKPVNIITDETKSLIAPLKDKVIVNFGDSIFGRSRPPEDISTRLAELTGATVYNCGFGGTLMSAVSNNFQPFCMVELAKAITSRDFNIQDTAINDSSSLPSYYAETLALLKSIDFDEVDIITIAHGTNDHNYVDLDNADNPLDIYKIMGALRFSIETILTTYPHIKIFICSQTYRFWMDSNGEFIEDTDTHKSTNKEHTYKNLLEATEAVAKQYKLPYIDNYYALGINKLNKGHYFPATDGTHHNINGRRLLAAHIAKELY